MALRTVYGHLKIRLGNQRKGDVQYLLAALLASEYFKLVSKIDIDWAHGVHEIHMVATEDFGSSITDCRSNIQQWLAGILKPLSDEFAAERPFSVYATVPV